jgi:hypothetical protein
VILVGSPIDITVLSGSALNQLTDAIADAHIALRKEQERTVRCKARILYWTTISWPG